MNKSSLEDGSLSILKNLVENKIWYVFCGRYLLQNVANVFI